MIYTIRDNNGNIVCSIESTNDKLDSLTKYKMTKEYTKWLNLMKSISDILNDNIITDMQHLNLKHIKWFEQTQTEFDYPSPFYVDENNNIRDQHSSMYTEDKDISLDEKNGYIQQSIQIKNNRAIFKFQFNISILAELKEFNECKSFSDELVKRIDSVLRTKLSRILNKHKIQLKCTNDINKYKRGNGDYIMSNIFIIFQLNLLKNDLNLIDNKNEKEVIDNITKYLNKNLSKYKQLTKIIEKKLKEKFKIDFEVVPYSWLDVYMSENNYISNIKNKIKKMKSQNKKELIINNNTIIDLLYDDINNFNIFDAFGFNIESTDDNDYRFELNNYFKTEFNINDFKFSQINQIDNEYHLLLIPTEKLIIKL